MQDILGQSGRALPVCLRQCGAISRHSPLLMKNFGEAVEAK
jgi:hypothetical protein